jgi:hypothetical protein
MQFRWGVAWKGRGWRTALEVLMPGLTLGLGMDIVGPEMLSASKLFATRIIVESEHTPLASCAPPPPPPPFFNLVLSFFFTLHYEMDCACSCLFCRFKDFSPEALVTFLLRLVSNQVMLCFHDGSSFLHRTLAINTWTATKRITSVIQSGWTILALLMAFQLSPISLIFFRM